MIKTYISSLLVVVLAGAQTTRAQGSLDDVFAQLDAAQGETKQVASPAAVQTAQPAVVQTEQPAAVQIETPVVTQSSGDLFSRGVSFYRAG